MIRQSVFGCCSFIALAWLLSENRRRVTFRLVVKGFLLTFAAGLVLVYVPFSRDVFALLNRMVLALQEATHAGPFGPRLRLAQELLDPDPREGP